MSSLSKKTLRSERGSGDGNDKRIHKSMIDIHPDKVKDDTTPLSHTAPNDTCGCWMPDWMLKNPMKIAYNQCKSNRQNL